jgi:hypothetical protein
MRRLALVETRLMSTAVASIACAVPLFEQLDRSSTRNEQTSHPSSSLFSN